MRQANLDVEKWGSNEACRPAPYIAGRNTRCENTASYLRHCDCYANDDAQPSEVTASVAKENMGASVGTDSKGSVNVELNVVPFIDLMICLTAFLLVTAVWSRYAQLDVQPTGQGPAHGAALDPILSVLIMPDVIALGLGVPGAPPDWRSLSRERWAITGPKLRQMLTELRADPRLAASNPNRNTIEVGADESGLAGGHATQVIYQDIIAVMDSARLEGFTALKLLAPRALTHKPPLR